MWLKVEKALDHLWPKLASVKITLVVFVLILLLSIPGTVLMQYNMSNVDPGAQYDFAFWEWGKTLQLFTAYQSFWYVGLIVLLSMNLIACSCIRWPAMFRAARVKLKAFPKERWEQQAADWKHGWSSSKNASDVKKIVIDDLKKQWIKAHVFEESENSFQIVWQIGRWSRVANVLVHTSLLVVFMGAIVTAMYGFEGATNIPEGRAVDSFMIFKEGKGAGLVKPRDSRALLAERFLGREKADGLDRFRLKAKRFDVEFYKDFPGRPKDFRTQLEVIQDGKVVKAGVLQVNRPMRFDNFVFYQSSYGALGYQKIKARVLSVADKGKTEELVEFSTGEALKLKKFPFSLVPFQIARDLMGLGPAVHFQEWRNKKAVGKAFWVLMNLPQFDVETRQGKYTIVIDDIKNAYFTGLQIGYDPGAPIYWLGSFGMLVGTFYALFVTHRKFYLRFEKGKIEFTGSIHRLPMGFKDFLAKLATRLKGKTV